MTPPQTAFTTLIDAPTLLNWLHTDTVTAEGVHASWNDLPPDPHLRDGGHYRHRRHACYVQTLESNSMQATPHRAHWQPTDYNALHGGFERWFEPVEPAVSQAGLWTGLLLALVPGGEAVTHMTFEPDDGRANGWREAQRKAWEKLWASNGSGGAAPGLARKAMRGSVLRPTSL